MRIFFSCGSSSANFIFPFLILSSLLFIELNSIDSSFDLILLTVSTFSLNCKFLNSMFECLNEVWCRTYCFSTSTASIRRRFFWLLAKFSGVIAFGAEFIYKSVNIDIGSASGCIIVASVYFAIKSSSVSISHVSVAKFWFDFAPVL